MGTCTINRPVSASELGGVVPTSLEGGRTRRQCVYAAASSLNSRASTCGLRDERERAGASLGRPCNAWLVDATSA